MRIEYVGHSADCKYRYAVINSAVSEHDLREYILNELDRLDGRPIDGYGDPEMQNDWIVVEDRDDYDWIKEIYQNAKKAYSARKKERRS